MLISTKLLHIQIICWENILMSPLSWQERSNAHNHLSELYHQKYYIRTTVISKKLFEPNGSWYIFEEF